MSNGIKPPSETESQVVAPVCYGDPFDTPEWKLVVGLSVAWLALGVTVAVNSPRLVHPRFDNPLMWLVVAYMASSFALLGLVTLRLRRKALAQFDLGVLPHDADSDVYVGVAYQVWSADRVEGPAWDRGFLRVEQGLVSFRGHGPGFALPVSCVCGVGRRGAGPRPKSLANAVGVDWRSEDGAQHTVWLQALDTAARRPSKAAAERLTSWLAEAVSAGASGDEQGAVWPSTMSRELFSGLPGELWVGRFVLPISCAFVILLCFDTLFPWDKTVLEPWHFSYVVLVFTLLVGGCTWMHWALLQKLKREAQRGEGGR